jgi:undecaprenyl-diphosphatase
MIEYLKNIDKEIFVLINGMHNSFFDEVMYWVSHKFFWIPFYIFLLYVVIKNFKKQSWLIILSIALLTVLTDQISVHLFKNVFLRYRPCHNIELQSVVHLLNNHCGGMYGFVSSHAANTFGLATFLIFLFADKKWTSLLLFWAALVCYSRIYAGVHYPADVIVGGLLGAVLGFGVYYLMLKVKLLSITKNKS